jgi:oligoribonuclease NrnB/cAMP/cGMP phosphodiesterase (DHH superfamily)
MNHIVYHKSDLDGWCSAAITIMHCEDKREIVRLWPAEYNDFDFEALARAVSVEDTVYVLDYSFCPDVMRLCLNGAKVVWIDHHKSAIELYEQKLLENPDKAISGMRDTGFAACELTWMYLYPDKKMPKLVRLLGIYDSWRKSHDLFRAATYLQHFARTSWMQEPLDGRWRNFLTPGDKNATRKVDRAVDGMVNTGVLIGQAAEARWADSAKARSFAVTMDGLQVLCLNSAEKGSQLFDVVWNPDRYDAMMVFGLDGKTHKWTCSVYSTKPEVDCSEFCKRRGGGGHKAAAGFVVMSFDDLFTSMTEEAK